MWIKTTEMYTVNKVKFATYEIASEQTPFNFFDLWEILYTLGLWSPSVHKIAQKSGVLQIMAISTFLTLSLNKIKLILRSI